MNKLLAPDEEAWLYDARKKLQDAIQHLTIAFSMSAEPIPTYDEVDHHVRLAQGKLAIARVDLSAARTAAARHGSAVVSPTAPPANYHDEDLLADDEHI